MPKDNPHKKHRERVRKEFLQYGFSNTAPPHKIPEMLLFYSIPRKDTNEIAHALLKRFGSFTNILEASPDELMRVDGIGENSAALLKLILNVIKLYRQGNEGNNPIIRTMDDLCNFVMKRYIGLTKEAFAVTCLNSQNKVISFDVLNYGDLTSVGISNRAVVEKILERNAVSAVISHNHPSGRALPSPEDVAITKEIFSALSHLNIRLLDHIIVSNEDNDCISMVQSKKYQHIFK